jgi:hypothetical protein
MGDEGREEDRPIELAFLVHSICDRAYAPRAFYPLRTEAKVRKGSTAVHPFIMREGAGVG